MQKNLKNLLTQADCPITVISYVPVEAEFDREGIAKDVIEQQMESGFPHSFHHFFVGEGIGKIREVLDDIGPDHGLIIMSSNVDSKSVQIVENYSPEEVVKLRGNEEAQQKLYAQCLMTSEASEPALPSVPADDGSASESRLKASDEMLTEIKDLDKTSQLFSTDKLAVYLFQGKEAPAVMQLIGAARAVTFAAIGAGAGQEIDLSEEDDYYHHLLLWDRELNCLVGAYRLGFTSEILAKQGKVGMYLDHVFEIQPKFYEKLGNAMELSRSFVLPSYQKNPQMLDALWKGIGHAAIKKDCYILYGSVTISDSFTPLSKAILVDTLDRYYSEDIELRNAVHSKVPFTASTTHHAKVADVWANQGLNKLNKVILDLENEHRAIPPLIRYYVSLGAKFMSFQVEESFSNAIYCLLKVDLKELPKRYKKRFLGEG